MIKKLSKMFLIFTLLIASVCVFFPLLKTENSASAEAAVSVSGNKIVLTGLNGFSPQHFFNDENGESTLVNAQAESSNLWEHYIISSKNRGKVSGWSEYKPTEDLKPFFDKKIIYAKASAIVYSAMETPTFNLTISSGEKKAQAEVTVGDGKTKVPELEQLRNVKYSVVETDLLPLDINENIRFSFETKTESFGASGAVTIAEPTIHLYTAIDSVTLDCEDQTVYPGQRLSVNAYNDVTSIDGTFGNFLVFSKRNHEINFEFLKGGEYVEVVGSNFFISGDAPQGAEIKFRAFAKKNSFSQEIIYSDNIVTLTVNTNKVNVIVRTDFDSPAIITGERQCLPGQRVSLRVTPKEGYDFLGWYVDDVLVEPIKLKLDLNANGQKIYAKFRKHISVKEIKVASRAYDGTTNIYPEQDVSIVFDGLENGHQIKLEGVTLSYANANAGKNKNVNAQYEELTLSGENQDIYAIEQILPDVFGQIDKKDVTVFAQKTTKEYGDSDPVINYTNDGNVVEGETLVGKLGRKDGEEPGEYAITIGELSDKNTNYNIILGNQEKFVIEKRTLSFENILVAEKTYDGTTEANVSVNLKNIFNNEDVDVTLDAEFVSADVGTNIEVIINSFELSGADKEHYRVAEFTQQIFGTITEKQISVQAKDCTFTYGDEINLEYDVTGLVGDDTLEGSLEVDSNNAGSHEIKIGTLHNKNYVIEFASATCEILPRKITVEADKKTKDFGDNDPQLSYNATDMIEGDVLFGALEREVGEDVGTYKISLGNLQNPNYEITKFVGNEFEITPRQIEVNIEFLDKAYDGTDTVLWQVNFENNIKDADFNLSLEASLDKISCGNASVVIGEQSVECDDVENYTFEFNFLNFEIEIQKRNATVFVDDDLSKFYGASDPEYSYIVDNVVAGETLSVSLQREQGEDAGEYKFDFAVEPEFQNYSVSLVESYFKILPKPVNVSVETKYKTFGDEDPAIPFEIRGEFAFDDTKEKVIDGQVCREQGESVGVYAFDLTKLSSNKNYEFVNIEDANFIIQKRVVTVTTYDATKTYGDEDPKFDYKVENTVEGEELTVKISREAGEDVGTYRLFCGTTNDARYIINNSDSETGFLTITKSEITIKADEKTKIYGDEDPTLTVTVVSGFLTNNDRMEDICKGKLSRKEGEDVGTYVIERGSFSLGENYQVEFVEGSLSIIQRHVTISALASSKIYGTTDPKLEFELSTALYFSDTVFGKLGREDGETAGAYTIKQGDISLSDNYTFDFVSNTFTILPRPIEIVATNTTKTYGDQIGEINYTIDGELIGDDSLEGQLYTKVDDEQRPNVGKYLIYSTLKNDNYDIKFADTYFEIVPRGITIEAQSYTITYGDAEPVLNYKVTSGTILEGDYVSGEIHRMKGNSVGEYDIISSLTLGRNYSITYVKGTVKILPLDITIKTANYQKIYGQQDPQFSYQIVEGKLINDDVLYGAIYREEGEEVGTYNLIKGLYNTNYNITLLPATLTISQKDIYLVTSVYNKTYDGTNKATLKNPYIYGVIDDVYLDFDRHNCADFISSKVGTNIKVILHDISLTGEKAHNYNLVLPTDLYADITLDNIEKDGVTVLAKDPVLYEDYELNFSSEILEEDVEKIKNHDFVLSYNIWLEKDGYQINPDSIFTITINLPKKIYKKNNIYIYQKLEDGSLKLISSSKDEDGDIVMTASLGEFYIAIEDDTWVDYSFYTSIVIVASLMILLVIIVCLKYNKKYKIK